MCVCVWGGLDGCLFVCARVVCVKFLRIHCSTMRPTWCEYVYIHIRYYLTCTLEFKFRHCHIHRYAGSFLLVLAPNSKLCYSVTDRFWLLSPIRPIFPHLACRSVCLLLFFLSVAIFLSVSSRKEKANF